MENEVLDVLPRGATPINCTCTRNRGGSARLLDVNNEGTESEYKVEKPDNEESTQRQPALNTCTGLL